MSQEYQKAERYINYEPHYYRALQFGRRIQVTNQDGEHLTFEEDDYQVWIEGEPNGWTPIRKEQFERFFKPLVESKWRELTEAEAEQLPSATYTIESTDTPEEIPDGYVKGRGK